MSHAAHTQRGRYRSPVLFSVIGVVFLLGSGLAYASYAAPGPAASINAHRQHQGPVSGRLLHRVRQGRRHSSAAHQMAVSVTSSPTPDPAPASGPPGGSVSAPAPSSATG